MLRGSPSPSAQPPSAATSATGATTASGSTGSVPDPALAGLRPIWADLDRRIAAATSPAWNAAYDVRPLFDVFTGSALASSYYKAYRYARTGERDAGIAVATTPRTLYAAPAGQDPNELLCAITSLTRIDDDKSGLAELVVLRRASAKSPWMIDTWAEYAASDPPVPLPAGTEPEPVTAAERRRVDAAVERVLRHFDGGSDEGLLHGGNLEAARDGYFPPYTVIETTSTTRLYAPRGSAPTVVVRRVRDGLLAMVSAMRTVEAVDTHGTAVLDATEQEVYGNTSSRATVHFTVPFAVLVREGARPHVVAAESSWAIPTPRRPSR